MSFVTRVIECVHVVNGVFNLRVIHQNKTTSTSKIFPQSCLSTEKKKVFRNLIASRRVKIWASQMKISILLCQHFELKLVKISLKSSLCPKSIPFNFSYLLVNKLEQSPFNSTSAKGSFDHDDEALGKEGIL